MQVHIQIDISEQQLATFRDLFENVTSLLDRLKWQEHVQIDNVHERNHSLEAERKRLEFEYEDEVCHLFEEFINKGNTPRESFSLTVTAASQINPQSSYDNVKKILTKNKYLKKTGFYSKNHKYA